MMPVSLLLQIPPIPTALPPGVPNFDMPVDLWDSVPTMVQTYRFVGEAQNQLEGIFVLVVIVLGATVVWKAFNRIVRRDAER